MWQEEIKFVGPYDFDLALSRLAMDPLNIINQKERSIKVPIYDLAPEVATVQATGTTDEPVFLVSGENSATKSKVIERISAVFQWKTSLAEIQTHFLTTSLNKIFQNHRGTPIVLDFSPFTTLVKSIIHQQVNMKFAISLTEQFVKTFGYEISGVYFYPSPETIANIEPETLRALKFSQRKAEYVIGLAKEIVNGAINLELLSKLSDEEIMKELVKVRGIGPWTVQCYLLFGLGRPNLFPLADIGLQNAIKDLHGLDRKPTKEEMLEYSGEWQPYLSYASLYLWRSIEPPIKELIVE
ncbi:DNA-3-methyladenine glycosylase family protein [Lederbergia panacisoli]|uniref:DNA-3-methyladenine glycosylase family protein n=1 Tax=Lederbergia panacisoli TaxID=1255251 RepID=UPI00214BE17A|nr:DNA-3-methyladenine glycosylase [Lederbergia panacisoli]MCR2822076.1 DNA-3-methyladenine glycosylase [Lederbergia panacisoli]